MENVFEIVITKLLEVGFYDLLIFVCSLTMFYAILKKYKLLGDSPSINAVLAFIMAFMVFGYPVIVGFSLTLPLVKFFTQSLLWVMLFFMGVLISSVFYPDLPKLLIKKFTSRTAIWAGVFFTIVSMIVSGWASVLWMSPVTEGNIVIPFDLSITAAGLIVFIIILLIGASVVVSD